MLGKLWLAGAATAAILGSSAAVASVVVVKSLGPSSKAYPPGKTLPESAKITLQGGDVVTVLGPAAAQTLRGPGNFSAGQMTLASAERGRFGALRAADVAHNPSIWDIDVSQSGKMCVRDASKLQLWRPDKEAAATVKIHDADGKSQELSWAAGVALAPWPAALPVKNGAEYQVDWGDGGDSNKLDLVTIVPPPPDDLVGAAQVLINHGCQKQLDLLVQSASKTGN
jgi:hypothetical protein